MTADTSDVVFPQNDKVGYYDAFGLDMNSMLLNSLTDFYLPSETESCLS